MNTNANSNSNNNSSCEEYNWKYYLFTVRIWSLLQSKLLSLLHVKVKSL